MGSIAWKLAVVASGSADAADADLNISVAPKNEWDVCAGDLLVREAGGRYVDFHGDPRAYNQEKTLIDCYMAAGSASLLDQFFVRERDTGRLTGVFELSEITRGILQSAYLGFYAMVTHEGQGYMQEGLQLVLRHAFRGLRLHRVEANIQPANKRSITLVKRGGFRKEGLSRRYLKIGGRWRDHERWALLYEDWRALRSRG